MRYFGVRLFVLGDKVSRYLEQRNERVVVADSAAVVWMAFLLALVIVIEAVCLRCRCQLCVGKDNDVGNVSDACW